MVETQLKTQTVDVIYVNVARSLICAKHDETKHHHLVYGPWYIPYEGYAESSKKQHP